jgi:hypothetical protein
VAAVGVAADEGAAEGFTGGAVKGAVGASDSGAASGVAVTGAANGVAVAGAANGVAVTGAAAGDEALPGCAAGPGANGGVAVEGMGIAGLAVATGSCEVMTFALPGGATTGVPSVVGTSASCRFATSRLATSGCAASRLRAAVACALFGLNAGGSVGFLT